MTILRFNQSPAHAFADGFVRGMAAPVTLFAINQAPALKPFTPVVPLARSAEQAQREDWEKIASDFKLAIGKHGATS